MLSSETRESIHSTVLWDISKTRVQDSSIQYPVHLDASQESVVVDSAYHVYISVRPKFC